MLKGKELFAAMLGIAAAGLPTPGKSIHSTCICGGDVVKVSSSKSWVKVRCLRCGAKEKRKNGNG